MDNQQTKALLVVGYLWANLTSFIPHKKPISSKTDKSLDKQQKL